MKIPTIRVRNADGQEFLINEGDYNAAIHTLITAESSENEDEELEDNSGSSSLDEYENDDEDTV